MKSEKAKVVGLFVLHLLVYLLKGIGKLLLFLLCLAMPFFIPFLQLSRGSGNSKPAKQNPKDEKLKREIAHLRNQLASLKANA
jgi:hypothetical protein